MKCGGVEWMEAKGEARRREERRKGKRPSGLNERPDVRMTEIGEVRIAHGGRRARVGVALGHGMSPLSRRLLVSAA